MTTRCAWLYRCVFAGFALLVFASCAGARQPPPNVENADGVPRTGWTGESLDPAEASADSLDEIPESVALVEESESPVDATAELPPDQANGERVGEANDQSTTPEQALAAGRLVVEPSNASFR